eukprot:comp16789_c0_seq1/m.15170 comp16789_c0_seq1/g.15170  ORF comp16789_c0_seq1/g.15170 comp16789_c0_seq1/m.15170 type:complete len:351 (-) comp16789_c0_seq1:364-1416(-)
MGKKSRRRPDVKSGTKASPGAKKGAAKKYTADELLDRVEEYVERFEFEMAHRFCAKALEQEPDNLRALEAMAEIFIEGGDGESAKECLDKAIWLSPNHGPSKYLCLGQLLQGADAVAAYRRGVELLKKDMQAVSEGTEEGDEGMLRRAASSAMCSIAEIYMTDLCDEEVAEEECRKSLEAAVELDGTNAEAYQTFCSFWISASNNQKAGEMLTQSMQLWQGSEDPDQLPPYEFRVATVRLLAELGRYEEAVKVLRQLETEDDEVVDVWYLHGWVGHLTGDADTAVECLVHARKLYGKVGCDDETMLGHIDELLAGYQESGHYNPEDEWVDEIEDDTMEVEEGGEGMDTDE